MNFSHVPVSELEARRLYLRSGRKVGDWTKYLRTVEGLRCQS